MVGGDDDVVPRGGGQDDVEVAPHLLPALVPGAPGEIVVVEGVASLLANHPNVPAGAVMVSEQAGISNLRRPGSEREWDANSWRRAGGRRQHQGQQ